LLQFGVSLFAWALNKGLGEPAGLVGRLLDTLTEHAVGDAGSEVLKSVLERAGNRATGADGLPFNHAVEAASCDALRSAVHWLLQLEVYRRRRTVGEVLQDAGEYARTATELDGFLVRALAKPEERQWYQALNRALDGQAFVDWHAGLGLTREDLEVFDQPDRCDLRKFLAEHLLAFARRQITEGREPESFEKLVNGERLDGADASAHTNTPLSLADAYCICWRENVRMRPEVFRTLLSHELRAIHANVPLCINEALDRSLTPFRVLITSMHSALIRLVQEEGLSRAAVRELLSGQLMLQEQLWLGRESLQGLQQELRSLRSAPVSYEAVLATLPEDGVAREWFDEQLEAWLNQAEYRRAPPYLVLEAGPFFGKSWIAAAVFRARRDSFRAVVYHCFRRTEGLTDPMDAYRSLGEQLRPWAPGFTERAPESLREFLALLRQIPRTEAGKILIVIDGLDEAFGPLADLPGAKASDFLPSPEVVAESQVVFFITLRPDFLVSWRDDPRKYRRVRLPARDELVRDVAQALPLLRDRLRAQGLQVPPKSLLAHFAQASQGLLGLACQFFLGAAPEQWAHWLRTPQSIPHGPVSAMLDHWARVIAAAEVGGISPAAVRFLCVLLAAARDPLSAVQLGKLVQLAEDPSLNGLRPQLYRSDHLLGHLEAILAINVGTMRATSDVPGGRKYSFSHTAIADLLLGEIEGCHSEALPTRQERELAHQVLATAGMRLWQAENDLQDYALQHGPEHLRDVGRVDDLVDLVQAAHFQSVAESANSSRPDLGIAALRTALSALLARDSEGDIATKVDLAFLITERVEGLLRETPLQGTRRNFLRGLRLLREIPDARERFYRTLVVAYWLQEQGRNEEARQALHTLKGGSQTEAVRAGSATADLLKRLIAAQPGATLTAVTTVVSEYALRPLIVEALCAAPPDARVAIARAVRATFTETSSTHRLVVESLASLQDLDSARAAAGWMESGFEKLEAFLAIMRFSPDQSDADAALRQADLTEGDSPDSTRLAIVRALSPRGDLQDALGVAEAIDSERMKAEALLIVTQASVERGQLDCARRAAERITGIELRAQALLCIGLQTDQPDDFEAARLAAGLIQDEFRREKTFLQFAQSLAQRGRLEPVRELAQASRDRWSRSKILMEVARVLAGRGDLAAADSVVEMLEGGYKFGAMRVIAETLVAAGDLPAARGRALAIASPEERIKTLLAIADQSTERADMEAARAYADAITNNREKLEALLSIAQGTREERDFAAVRRNVPSANDPLKLDVLLGLAKTTGAADDFEAVGWKTSSHYPEVGDKVALRRLALAISRGGSVRGACRLAKTITDLAEPGQTLRDIVCGLTQRGELEAARVALEFMDVGYFRNAALGALVGAFAERGEIAAARVTADALARDTIEVTARLAMARSSADPNDLEAARRIAQAIRDRTGEERCRALLEVATHTRESADYELARGAAHAIQDSDSRTKALIEIASSTRAEVDFAAAREAAQALQPHGFFYTVTEAMVEIGRALAGSGFFDEARRLAALLKSDRTKGDASGRINAAIVLELVGRGALEEACGAAEAAGLSAEVAYALKFLVEAYVKRGDFVAASKVVTLMSSNNYAETAALVTLVEALVRAGDYKAARKMAVDAGGRTEVLTAIARISDDWQDFEAARRRAQESSENQRRKAILGLAEAVCGKPLVEGSKYERRVRLFVMGLLTDSIGERAQLLQLLPRVLELFARQRAKIEAVILQHLVPEPAA
jgi:hypothetical protein